ncbi:hydantoinase/oxoprolinase family protein [Clostridioides difficile]
MTKVMGIDTGGTYTDCVIIDSSTKKLLYKSKTLTTKQNLLLCVQECVKGIDTKYLEDISLVCLSTTLATNAIVEGKGCKEGLILIGGIPEGEMPTDRYKVIKGKYDIKGRVKENICEEEVKEVLEYFRNNVDALAVSGYASVRNPGHEIYVKEMIKRELDIPVACAHELTSTLGYYDRTVTVDLNAKLIPMICDLIDSVKTVMAENNINAPLMIVKGDGNLMTEHCAKDKPIETILSGPAASVMGGVFLSGEKDAFILDMGGTTTDIANIENGMLKVRDEGAKVGGWLTNVKAAEISTFGLGGDSRIYLDGCKNIKIGPQKSTPLCIAGDKYPTFVEELLEIYNMQQHNHFLYNETEAYILTNKYEKLSYSDDEKIIIEVLRYKPHTLHYLHNNINISNLSSKVDKLVNESVLSRISLTPTDVLHAIGDYCEWNCSISKIGLKIMAEQVGIDENSFVSDIKNIISIKLNKACLQSSMDFDRQNIDVNLNHVSDYFVNKIFLNDTSDVLKANYTLKKSIVAVGAPTSAWVKKTGEDLNTKIIIPNHAEVANAIGAAIGRVVQSIDILIRPDLSTNSYIAYTPIERKLFKCLEDATEYTLNSGREYVKKELKYSNDDYDINEAIEDIYSDDAINNVRVFIERNIRIDAIIKVC